MSGNSKQSSYDFSSQQWRLLQANRAPGMPPLVPLDAAKSENKKNVKFAETIPGQYYYRQFDQSKTFRKKTCSVQWRLEQGKQKNE